MQQSKPTVDFAGYLNQHAVSLELVSSESDSISLSLPSSSSASLVEVPSAVQQQQQHQHQKVATIARHDDDGDNDMRNRSEMQRPLLPERVGGSPLETPSSTALPTERQQKQHRADTVLGRWWSEMVGCGCMFLALLATVLTLALHQGRTIPEWPLAISVNAAISIHATVMQMSMMYVLAQSLSQMKWLWYSKPRQLRDLEAFDDASRGPWGAVKLIWRLRASHTAALGALLIIASLAVGPFLQQIVSTYSCQIIADGVQATIPRTNIYNISLNNGTFNNPTQEFTTDMIKGYEMISLNNTPQQELTYNSSVGVQVTAYSCQFGQSIGTYTASITNGHFEEVLHSTTLAFPYTSQSTLLDGNYVTQVMIELDCLSTHEREQLAGLGHKIYDIQEFIALNVTHNATTQEWITMYAPVHCMYANLDLDAIIEYTMSFFFGESSYAGYLEAPASLGLTSFMLDFLYLGGYATLSSINSTMASIANSMTASMRSDASGPADHHAPAVGIAYRTEVCVQVQWEWLGLPVVLATMTVLFFIFTLVATRSRRRGGHGTRNDWKSSMVALLFHGLEGRARERLGALNYHSEMEESAERMVVQLQCGSEGWQFVETQQVKRSPLAKDEGNEDVKDA
ncbi:hypothetical protein MMC17_004483 [Xylographa soralifera]|nr:hypothetical protein [Xylographa soralifera]